MADVTPRTYSREGYDPEWLALEDSMGGRYHMDGDLEKQIPIFDQSMEALAKLWPDPTPPLKIVDEDIDSPPFSMKCRWYRPDTSDQLPLVIYLHGGAFVAGNLNTDEPQCKYYAAKTPCVVMNLHYPLAPKYKFDDIKDATIQAAYWAQENAHRYNADSTKLILCGGSAGSYLSQAVAYHFTYILKDYDSIFGCVLLYPTVGNWLYDGPHSDKYRAWTDMATGDQPMLNRTLFEDVAKYWDINFTSPKHFQLFEDDLSKFPPCYLASAEKDILKDDGLVFDLRLKDVGVRSKFKFYKALPHWFHAFPQLTAAPGFYEDTVEGIRWLLSGKP